jgi:RNA polymerase sigma-70 factor (ECF subfamily)
VHCYRMLGSLEEAEDLVQETFLRAWKNLHGFEGRSTLRAWLYRIATNACLDSLDGRARRVLPHQVEAPSWPDETRSVHTEFSWLQPFPDSLYEQAEAQPESAAVARETIELAFLAAIQCLPPRQRAVLILRDVLGWPARETAALLDGSVASANSALQRARTTLREHLPADRWEWTAREPTERERAVLRRYMDAVERADLAAMAELLADEVRATMPPYPMWFQGRDALMAALAMSWDPASPSYVGRFRMVPTRANGRPAAAAYIRGPGETVHRAVGIGLLGIEDGLIVDLTAFHDPALFPLFGFPLEIPPEHR